MVKILKKDGRLFIELPEGFEEGKIRAIKMAKGIFVVATEDAVKKLLERQLYYMFRKKLGERVVRKEGTTTQRKENIEMPDYIILNSDEAARAFSARYAKELKSGEILGVKGFDGKYYAVRAEKYFEVLSAIRPVLEAGEKTVGEIASVTGLEKDLVKAVLEIAREEGTVYEARGGKYRYVG